MTDYNSLQKALIQVMDEELRTLEQEAKRTPHVFSREFEEKMQRLIKSQKKRRGNARKTLDKEFKPAHVKVFGHMMRRSAAVLLAAILILTSTIAAIAIVKPEVFFIIKEKLTHWDITPKQEKEENVPRDIVPVRVNPPAGVALAEEEFSEIGFACRFEDENGTEIRYSQKLPEGLSIAVDSEGISSRRTKLNGRDAAIFRHDENSTTIVLEDGVYVFVISGDDYDATLELAEKISLHS